MLQEIRGQIMIIRKFRSYYCIISLLESELEMQDHCQSKRSATNLLKQLMSKISRLRKRLVSCGYSCKEVIDIIFLQFLRLPEIEWSKLQETNNFYQFKSHFKVDSASAQIIMRLQKLIPNLHTIQVFQYLLTVLEINANDYGFNLIESSSQSNDSGSGMNKLIIQKSKRRLKNSIKREQLNQKRKKNNRDQPKCTKKVHHDEQYLKSKKTQQQVDLFFKNRPITKLLSYEEYQLQKQMKKMPESQDSDHQ